ncbi:pre-60S factor rei1, partial [Spiromyces aspiralis]
MDTYSRLASTESKAKSHQGTDEGDSILYTCLTCQIAFHTAIEQRNHYRTDWHRYNLKRKVAGLPP